MNLGHCAGYSQSHNTSYLSLSLSFSLAQHCMCCIGWLTLNERRRVILSIFIHARVSTRYIQRLIYINTGVGVIFHDCSRHCCHLHRNTQAHTERRKCFYLFAPARARTLMPRSCRDASSLYACDRFSKVINRFLSLLFGLPFFFRLLVPWLYTRALAVCTVAHTRSQRVPPLNVLFFAPSLCSSASMRSIIYIVCDWFISEIIVEWLLCVSSTL